MITIALLPFLGLGALAAACGFAFGILAMWHPATTPPATTPEATPRTEGPRLAGYLDLGPNTGCYVPRRDWPEPDWTADGTTFSEISAGFARLERNVIAETQPFTKIQGKYLY